MHFTQGLPHTNGGFYDILYHFLHRNGRSQADTIAFGDAKIDIPMLEYCAIGVAMGNGGPEILAVADMVTDDVEHDGLYHAFERLGLI
ncbi:HAD hydrolase family protein [Streptococcus cuniculi]|uniref:HAD hydrolase family protein n=1 Tax=Streptococcus cuniculi TaxID=1432788 RepID=UPI003A0FE663